MARSTELFQNFLSLRPAKIAGLFVISFLSHASYIANDFTWLDHGDIVEEHAILPINQLPRAFSQPFGSTHFYRPMITLIHSLDHFFYGKNAMSFHLINVLLHCIASLVVFQWVGVFFSLSINEALTASVVFALHPVSFLPVGSISYRSEIVLLIFVLLALTFYIRSRKMGRYFDLLACLFFYGLALGSKETALVLFPAFIIVWEIFTTQQRLRFHKGLAIAIVAISSGYLALRASAVPGFWGIGYHHLTLSEHVAVRFYSTSTFILNLISPLKPNLSDAVPIRTLLESGVSVGIVMVCLLVLFSFWFKWKKEGLLWIAVFCVALLPTLNLVPLPRFSSPHYAYIATSMFGVFGVWLLRFSFHFRIPVMLWLCFAFFSTFMAGFRFKDDTTLFTPEVASDSNFIEGRFYIANYYFRQKKFAEAKAQYEKIFEATKQPFLAYVDGTALAINRAAIHIEEGELPQARLVLEALEQKGTVSNPLFYYHRALIAWKENRYEEVTQILQDRKFRQAEPYLLLAAAYEKLGKIHEATTALQSSLLCAKGLKRSQIERMLLSRPQSSMD